MCVKIWTDLTNVDQEYVLIRTGLRNKPNTQECNTLN